MADTKWILVLGFQLTAF